MYSIAQTIPGFGDKTPALQSQIFSIIPNINLLLQRMQYLYVDNKKQAKYQFAQALKLQQKKQSLISGCQKKLNKIVGDALANILTIQNSMLKANENEYFIPSQRANRTRIPTQTCCFKVMSFIQKYLRQLNKCTSSMYKSKIIKQIGLQFMNLLIQHYSHILYTKEGLGNIFIDIANYKKIIIQIDFPQIQQKYKILRALIDIYVIKNDEKTVNAYVKAEKDEVLKGIKEEVIKEYIANKARNEKGGY